MADTHAIPAPAAPIAKPATARAAMDLIDDAAHLDGAPPRQLSPGDADDLIAKMADAQIDQMLADDEAGKPPTLAKPPADPPSLDPLSAIDAMLAADETQVAPPKPKPAASAIDPMSAIDAMLAADEATAAPPKPKPAASAAVDPMSAIDAMLAADEASAAPPKPMPSAPAVDPLSAIDAMLAADDVPAAAPAATAFPASFSPPQPKRPAVADVPSAAEVFAAREPIAPPAEPSHELQSSADAVAAELAADARFTPPRAPAAEPKVDVEAAPHDDAEPHGLRAVPIATLDLINYPVRGLSDSAREVVGAIAIVTLANATALLIYLMLFRA